MVHGENLHQIYAVWILDDSGGRLATRYAARSKEYLPDYKAQIAFEKKVTAKISRPANDGAAEVDIVVVDDYMILYKSVNDIYICIVAPDTENEFILLTLLDGIFGSLHQAATGISMISSGLTKRSVLESLETVILILDEAQDDGVIMEVDSDSLLERVRMQASVGLSTPVSSMGPSSAETFAQAKQGVEGSAKKFLNNWWGGGSK